jgi:hypothetical protein
MFPSVKPGQKRLAIQHTAMPTLAVAGLNPDDTE